MQKFPREQGVSTAPRACICCGPLKSTPNSSPTETQRSSQSRRPLHLERRIHELQVAKESLRSGPFDLKKNPILSSLGRSLMDLAVGRESSLEVEDGGLSAARTTVMTMRRHRMLMSTSSWHRTTWSLRGTLTSSSWCEAWCQATWMIRVRSNDVYSDNVILRGHCGSLLGVLIVFRGWLSCSSFSFNWLLCWCFLLCHQIFGGSLGSEEGNMTSTTTSSSFTGHSQTFFSLCPLLIGWVKSHRSVLQWIMCIPGARATSMSKTPLSLQNV